MPTQSGDRVLIVEGIDDKHVVWNLCSVCNIDVDFEVREKGSVNSILSAVYDEARVPDRTHLGFLLDANDHPESRWQSLRNSLRRIGVELPPQPTEVGTIVQQSESPQRLGVWMMPNNVDSGELEDFVISMIPAQDDVWPLSQDYVNQIDPEHQKFIPGKITRAELYAWLAVRREPRLMGSAIGAGDLQPLGQACNMFINWLSDLFD